MRDGKHAVGILGLGGRGVYFGGKSFLENGNCYVSCVCDTQQEKCDAAKAVFGGDVRTYTDMDAFLRDPDLEAVIVTTPDYTHADCAVAVLKAKKHLYLESHGPDHRGLRPHH